MQEKLLLEGYERVVRPLLFRAGDGDAETAHHTALRLGAAAARVPGALAALRGLTRVPGSPRTVAGITFPNAVGLAAGVDKDAHALPLWEALGFGHVELGTVTPRPQPGNPTPRVHRLVESRAVLNAMGFPNDGVDLVVARLRVARAEGLTIPVGLSIGKNKDTPLEAAADDYVACVRAAAGLPDYLAVNVSSPNTPGLRGLQDAAPLRALLTATTRAETERAAAAGQEPTPVFVKLSPDMDNAALMEVAVIAQEAGCAALVATNTTLDRTTLDPGTARRIGTAGEEGSLPGGLSGAPLTSRAHEVISLLAASCDLPLVGVGGIMTPADAHALREAGAELVQVYTGFIYGGPALVAGIARRC
ncbi:quinone-dependent dihydroorotate dehydrogenase [Kytococcus aerolatus]|nr:quinone-dependent dihydroorotate dehydrogenase [Kytococcus aerolatus]